MVETHSINFEVDCTKRNCGEVMEIIARVTEQTAIVKG
jgi:hypothetical protein